MSVPADAERVHPGVYLHDGELHVHAPEFLEHLGLPVTPGNENAVANMVLDVAVRQGLGFAEEEL